MKNKEICKKCHDDYFDEDHCSDGKIWCPQTTLNIDFNNLIPKDCPHKLEHIVKYIIRRK